jgi:D-aspartate ligase
MTNKKLTDVYSGSVLINGAETITGYNAARSISGMGFSVYGLSMQANSLYLKADVWDEIYTVDYNCDQMIKISKNIMQRQKVRSQKPTLMLCQDEMVLFVSKHRDVLSKYFSFLLPPDDAVNLMMDKTKFHHWAINKGFNVPKSVIVSEKNEIEVALRGLNYPIAIKPLTRDEGWNKHFNNLKLFKYESLPDDISVLKESLNFTDKLIFQEWIPGNDDDVFFLLVMIGKNGGSYLAGRKIHQWPILTGSTAMCKSELMPEFQDEAIKILQSAQLSGLGSIEFKRDKRTNKYYITEPTVGRHDYQSYIATAAGVNLSLLYVLECMDYCYFNHFKPQEAVWIDELNFMRAVWNKQPSLIFKDFVYLIKKGNNSFATFNFKELKLFYSYVICTLRKKRRRFIRGISIR